VTNDLLKVRVRRTDSGMATVYTGRTSFAVARALELFESAPSLAEKELGLGVVNPRLSEIESQASIVTRASEALRYVPPEKLFLNPDCGFATFESRPVSDRGTAQAKLAAIADAAATLRRGLARN
jgi:5-methyltetrahydropteroyltriglutamate--homocysteine methyltransferase